jgi:NADPH:quinone reductase-like Zn-dependent oxidoreductase
MKAVAFDRYGPPEVLRPMTLTVPEPGPGEVLVRVCATSVNPLDWKIRARRSRVRPKTGMPRVLGFDLSGVVEQVGPEVKVVRAGEAVYGLIDYRRDGADAEYVRTREAFLYPKPAALSHEEAAALPLAGLTALQALRLLARMQEGERVLVIGATGGVGHLAVQIARAYGARVAAVCAAAHADTVRGLGAEAVYPYDAGDVPEAERFDIVFDTVKARTDAWARRRLNPRGRYVSTEPDLAGLFRARLMKLVGVRERCRVVVVMPDRHGLRYLGELVERGALRPVVQRVYPLEELAEAHRVSQAGHVVGKLVVKVADE